MAGRGRTPSPSQIVRQSSDDLRPLLNKILNADGDATSKMLVLQARTLEQLGQVHRDVGHVHQRLDAVEAELRKGHLCKRDGDFDDLEGDIDTLRQGSASTALAVASVDDRLEELEGQDMKRGRFWQWLGGAFGVFILSGCIGGVWWMSGHATADRQDHILLSEHKLAIKSLQVQVDRQVIPRLDKQKDQLVAFRDRLTMVDTVQGELVGHVWELRGLHRHRLSPAPYPMLRDR